MDDLVSRLARELPDTSKDRYDIAYQRGRSQARSSLLFGGMAIGLAAGALGMYLLDPRQGNGRRTELGQRLAAAGRDLSRTVAGRGTDLRNRAKGAATELGLPGTPASNAERREEAERVSWTARRATPRSAGAHLAASEEALDAREPMPVGSGRTD
jgi:gas vesicle protein